MTTYTELYAAAQSLKQLWYASTVANAATLASVLNPTGSRCAIISAVGAGGWKTNDSVPGGGGAFARTKILNLTDGEQLDIQVGNPKFALDAGTSSADSWVKRTGTGVTLCKAARGTGIVANISGSVLNGGTPGLDTDCIGDIKRSGKYGNQIGGQLIGGMSGDDLDQTYSLGFGGRGVHHGRYPAAGWGGGGIHRLVYDAYGHAKAFFPGAGRVCIEFFTKDPGYF